MKHSALVLAYPNIYEWFGLQLLEAMVHGLPALIGKSGSLPELAGGAAVEVDAEDADAIAAGLEQLLADADLRAKLGDAGRRRAAEFTWAKAGMTTLEVLRRVAGG